jgi:[protein-PII] uridylyltransferase
MPRAPLSPPAPLSLAPLRQQLREAKAARVAEFTQRRPTPARARLLLKGLAKEVDATLKALWTQQGPNDAALVAVGGYGRGELFPASDVDVLIVLPQPATADQSQSIEGFVTACWDIGLDIGSSVRTVQECVEEGARDVTVQTAMLESRLLCGDPALYAKYALAQQRALDPRAFFRAKALEMQQRHAKFEDTPYALEPHCKESPGGLRDLQVVIWVARAAGLGASWRELASKGLITAFEARQLSRNEGLLRCIRAHLHAVAGRREDRLVFDLQTAVAERFGLTARPGERVSEALMRRYYWAAKAVSQLNQILMLNIQEHVEGTQNAPMRPINEKFLERGGMLEVASDDLYQRDPHAILETFLTYQTVVGPKGLSARTLRALYNARRLMNAPFRRDPVNRATFMKILMAPEGQTHAFRLMNQTSVLGRYLWVFRRIVGQMQHDLFHVYTVDQHILMVLRNVRRFFVPEHAHEYPLCSQLAANWDKPWVLVLAALFHDVAKGRGGDHSDLGAHEVRRFCRDHGVAREDAALVEFLVHSHLLMSNVAQKEDLADPDVIDRFAGTVGDTRRLTALYLLTVADIRGTSPKVWNAWKGKLLEDLYRRTLRALGGQGTGIDAEVQSRKLEARQELNLRMLPAQAEQALWSTLEVSYFARHDAPDIAWHTRQLHDKLDSNTPLVSARPSPVGEGLQVLVYAPDQSDLFARICGYFDSGQFNILDAKVHTTRRGYALDTFQVLSPHGDQHRDLVALVEHQLSATLRAPAPLPEPRKGRVSRRVKTFPITPRVMMRPDERAQRWLLSVSASDRAGLLYAIARVMARHGVNLQLAKISTLGERVEDTFLIDGPTLQHNRSQLQFESDVLEALSGP